MDTEALVDRDIEEGRRLVQALDQAAFPVEAAFWNFLPEESGWRLVIASTRVGDLGPLAAYAAIQDVLLKSRIDLPLYRVSAVTLDEPLVTDLRHFAATDPAPFVGDRFLQKVVIGNSYVEGAYLYRASRIIGKTGTFELWSAVRDRARKVWTARRCKVTVEDGFFKKIEVEGFDLPQRSTKNGINAHLRVLVKLEERGGQTFGDVQRWNILGGRLQSVETVARGVRVEGNWASPSSATAGT